MAERTFIFYKFCFAHETLFPFHDLIEPGKTVKLVNVSSHILGPAESSCSYVTVMTKPGARARKAAANKKIAILD